MMNPFTLPARTTFFAIAAVAFGLIAFGLFLQHAVGLVPCPMCIMQRYAFITLGLVALIAGIHHPANTGTRVYAGLILLLALAGGGVAARQTWMQLYPPEIPECGPGLEYMLGSFPLTDALPMIFQGAGDCSKVDWTFAGLSIANWSLVMFTAVALVAASLLLRGRNRA